MCRHRLGLLCLLLLGAAQASVGRSGSPKTFKVHIAHVNDVHNRIQDANKGLVSPCSPEDEAAGKCFGGYGRLSTMGRSLRQKAARAGATFYLLNAGDEFLGTLWDVVAPGVATARLQKLVASIRPDAQTLGNHDFDYGPAVLASYIKNTTQPFVTCNIDASKDKSMRGLVKKWTLLKHSSLKIAVLGWTTPDIGGTSSSGQYITFSPVNDAVKAAVAELKAAMPNLDLIIGLSHAGYDIDLTTAAAVPELDLIIGGHTHTFLGNIGSLPITDITIADATAANCVDLKACDAPSGPYPTYVNSTLPGGATKRVPVVTASWGSKYMGSLRLTVAKGKGIVSLAGEPVLLGGVNSSNPVAQDPWVAKVIAPMTPAVDALRTQVIGSTQVAMTGDPVIARRQETNYGNYLCDYNLRYINGQLPSFTDTYGPATVCIVNGGIFRDNLPQGNVTTGLVVTSLPYGNTLAIARLSGAQLVAALQQGLSAWPNKGYFLQVSGLRYYHNNGSFLAAFLLVNGQEAAIDPAAKFVVSITDYLDEGKDGFSMVAAGETLMPSGKPLDQMVAADITATPAGITAAVEGRIVNCGEVDCAAAAQLPQGTVSVCCGSGGGR